MRALFILWLVVAVGCAAVEWHVLRMQRGSAGVWAYLLPLGFLIGSGFWVAAWRSRRRGR